MYGQEVILHKLLSTTYLVIQLTDYHLVYKKGENNPQHIPELKGMS